jgi:hypothetical protein
MLSFSSFRGSRIVTAARWINIFHGYLGVTAAAELCQDCVAASAAASKNETPPKPTVDG